jgi:hypothetical protein
MVHIVCCNQMNTQSVPTEAQQDLDVVQIQGMLQHVSITGYAEACFYYKVCCNVCLFRVCSNMFLLQSMLQHVSIQGMLQHVSITGYVGTCFYYRVCCNMFRPFCAYVGTDIYTHLLNSSTAIHPQRQQQSTCMYFSLLTSLTPYTLNITQKSFRRQLVTEGQSASRSPVPSSVKSVLGFRRFLSSFMLLIFCTVRFKAH